MMTIQGMKYKSDFEAKKAILDIGRRMYAKGFVASNDGNISCRVGPNTIWTTPTGVSKGFMTQDMLVKMDLDGKVLMGRLKPSSEIKMHLRVYQENPRLQAVTQDVYKRQSFTGAKIRQKRRICNGPCLLSPNRVCNMP